MLTVTQLIEQLQTMRGDLLVQVLQTKTGSTAALREVQEFTFADSIEICEDDGDVETVLLYV